MPSLGSDMDEGTLLEWRIRPGERVARGQIVALVDTEKAEIEIECWHDGVVEQLYAQVGQTLPVGAPLARLREGEGAAAAVAAPPTPPPQASAPPAPPPARAPEPAPLAAHAEPGARRHVTPLARRLAQQRGVELSALAGSGPGGAIVAEDVERAAARPVAAPPQAAPASVAVAPAAPAPARERRESVRRAIATALAKSKREIPHYYLSSALDCARALEWLRERNAQRPVTERLLPIALLLAATAKALRRAPELCGRYQGGAFQPAPGIHLAVVVSLRGGGLVAPVLRDADALPLDALMRALAEQTRRAREGRLRSGDVADASITVTSLGELGVDSVFPVIHPPQVAIVGFGRIAEAPVAVSGMLAVRPVVHCTLAADHRVSDGMRGARYLAELGRLLGRPEEL